MKSRILTVCLGVALAFSVLGVTDAAAQNGKVRIAVMNFENNSTWSWWGDNLGRAAADELTTQLFKGDLFSVIERAQLDAILAEQARMPAGCGTGADALGTRGVSMSCSSL